jgi:hypothetical protein
MGFFGEFMVGRNIVTEGQPYLSRKKFSEKFGSEAATLLDVLKSNEAVQEQFDIVGIRDRFINITKCSPEDLDSFLTTEKAEHDAQIRRVQNAISNHDSFEAGQVGKREFQRSKSKGHFNT